MLPVDLNTASLARRASGDKMLLSFLVPASLLPMPHGPAAALDADRDTKMGAQEQQLGNGKV